MPRLRKAWGAVALLQFSCLVIASPTFANPPNTARAAPVPALPTQAPPAFALTLRIGAQKGPHGVQRAVGDRARVYTDDRMWFEISTDHSVYLYLLHIFPDGTASLYAEALEVPAEHVERIPNSPSKALSFDGSTGMEHLLVIATTSPLTAVDRAQANVVSYVKDHGRWPPDNPIGVQPRLRAAPRGVQRPLWNNRGTDTKNRSIRINSNENGIAVRYVQLRRRRGRTRHSKSLDANPAAGLARPKG